MPRVCGGPGLKDSQHYPPAFGRAFCRVFKQNRFRLYQAAASAECDDPQPNTELEFLLEHGFLREPLTDSAAWHDANLAPVLEYLETLGEALYAERVAQHAAVHGA